MDVMNFWLLSMVVLSFVSKWFGIYGELIFFVEFGCVFFEEICFDCLSFCGYILVDLFCLFFFNDFGNCNFLLKVRGFFEGLDWVVL